jgi:hypothetical protein
VGERLALLALLASAAGGGFALSTLLTRRISAMRRIATATTLAGILALAGAGPVRAQEVVATLALDSLSFVSFGDREMLGIPAGSTVRFRFGAPSRDGGVPFTIQPGDVAIGPIPLPAQRGDLLYGLAGPASGTLRRGDDGRFVIEFSATVSATLSSLEGGGTNTYPVRFTTEKAVAQAGDGSAPIAVEGMRVVSGARSVQLVAGATNQANSLIEPKAAVYTVLSGTFDRLPATP